MRPSWAEIDLTAVAANVRAFTAHLGDTGLCAVVKADAYGHGDVPVAETAIDHGASWLAVALLEEGIRLRESGIESPILLLSEPRPEDAPLVGRWDLTATVYSSTFLSALAGHATPPIHLKLDTGMHRVGTDVEGLAALLDGARRHRIPIGGVWTHFAVAEEDPDYTAQQRNRLREAVERLDVPDDVLVHDSNTAGAILDPWGDMARVGLGLYGLYPSPACRDRIDLRPAMRIVSQVSHVRRHPQGTRPSYGRRRPLPATANVATVPIGYADGVPRVLSDVGEVLIGGRRRPLAGTVTMDQVVIDCDGDAVAVGDSVVLIGRQGSEEVTADEWAAAAGTISYEIVCGIGPRLPRRFVE